MNPETRPPEAESTQRNLSTADLAAAADNAPRQRGARRPSAQDANVETPKQDDLAPLFAPDAANQFRSRWEAVQTSFVDDPREAVRQGDELVAQVMKELAETFANERSKLEGQLDQGKDASTEDLRVAFRRYRSFFERLLAV